MGTKITSLEATAATMQYVTDQLGKGIDPGIFESVVVLNVLHFTTQQSCEGHIGRGKPAPWITFTSPDAVSISREAARLFTQGEQAQETQGEEIAGALYEQANRLRRSAEALHGQDQRRMIAYLAKFYSTYRPAYDRMLIVYTRQPACSILESLGAAALVTEPMFIQERKLLEYLEEMRLFTTFLKEQILAHEMIQ